MTTLKETLDKIYHLVQYTNRNNFRLDAPDAMAERFARLDGRNGELIQAPEAVERESRGSCYDQTFLVKKWMDALGVESKVYHSITANVKCEDGIYCYSSGVTSHVFILCLLDGLWKWIEWSWYARINNDIADADLGVVLKRYDQIASGTWHHPVRIVEVGDVVLPMARIRFLNQCMNSPAVKI